MNRRFRSLACIPVLALGLMCLPVVATAGAVADEIRAILPPASQSDTVPKGRAGLKSAVLMPRMYALRDFEPAWSNPKSAQSLFSELRRGLDQGFRADDFNLSQLSDLQTAAKTGDPRAVAAFDVAATDAAVRLVHHVVFGKVDPSDLDSDWNFSEPVIENDPAKVLGDYLDGEGFDALMRRIDIKTAQYTMLIDALHRYQEIAADGGWPKVPDETVLKPGAVDPAIAVLRQRLAREGALNEGQVLPVPDAGSEVEPGWIYDSRLEADVKVFQARHGLEADGAVGPKTFVSLNRPVQDRVNQIRLSLERGRWLLRDEDEEFILVNIAGARTYLVKSDGTLWTTRSITGSEYRKTPVFRDEIKYMEFNPTWTVPASIFRKDKLSRIRKDPGYLARNNYVVRTRDGKTVSASSVNWNAGNPGVTLVQRPGPDNALGLVKFMFPNKYNVYMHDTNDRSLFDRNERHLSSGCVRVEYPFELANLLMEGDPDWSTARMQSILDSGKTTRINLPRPMPVLLTYWTAWAEGGVVHFREDPYGRDAAVLAELDR